MNLAIFLLLIFYCFLTIKCDSYFPCKSYISFSYDDSNTLNSAEFKKQMNFIKNVVGTLNYPNRLRAEGEYTGEFNWNSGLSISQMQQNIDSAQQNPIPFGSSGDSIAALIFISNTSDSALRNADRWFAKISGVHITFVLLGANVSSVKLHSYSSNFIYWQDFDIAQPDNWDLLMYNALGCSKDPSQTTLTQSPIFTRPTTTFRPSTASVSPSQYYPCKSWIHFGIDSSHSNAFNVSDFYDEVGFISNIVGTLNHPERIQVCDRTMEVPWYNHYSIKEIQSTVLAIEQFNNYSLRNQFKLLANLLLHYDPSPETIAAIFFISDTSDTALAGANQYMNYLTNVRITFVLLGTNVDATKLIQFSSNFIYWSDLNNPQPDNWDNLSYSAFGCSS